MFSVTIPSKLHIQSSASSKLQVANTKPVAWIWPSTLFYPAWYLVPTWWQHEALAYLLRSSHIYTVLKLHLALWRQLRGWCGPGWKWIWYPCSNLFWFPLTYSSFQLLYSSFLTGYFLCFLSPFLCFLSLRWCSEFLHSSPKFIEHPYNQCFELCIW